MNCSNFKLKNCVKGLRVTKNVKEIKFGEVWCEIEIKRSFQRQSFTKYLRLTLAFRWSSSLHEKFNLFFKSFSLVLIKFWLWQEDWALGYHSVKFWDFSDISGQLVYTMFITNNCASFHLWWKKNLVKHQKVSKYYENYCRYYILYNFVHEKNDLKEWSKSIIS